MSKKGTETPPPGANLISDFQTFCQSPAFISALQQNPLAAQMFQSLAPTPVYVPSIPESDHTINVRCLSQHLSKSFSDTLLLFPDVQSTWEYYAVNSKFTGIFDPLHFSSWIPAPPIVVPLTNSQLASQYFTKFCDNYPWSIFMKGILPSDTNYGHTLSLMGITNPSNPLPSLSENIVDSIVFLTFLHDMTTSMETILRPHFDALKYSINRVQFPDYDLSLPSSSYHIGWFVHYHNNNLVRNPHLLIQHFKSLTMAKSGTFLLNTHRKYLQSVVTFLKIFQPVLSVDPARSFKDFKDLISLNIHPNYVGVYIKSIQSGADSLDSFIKLIYENEDVIVRLPPPVLANSTASIPKPHGSPRNDSVKNDSSRMTATVTSKAKSVFLRCPTTCLNTPCARADHSVRICDHPCQLPGCPAPSFSPITRTLELELKASTTFKFTTTTTTYYILLLEKY